MSSDSGFVSPLHQQASNKTGQSIRYTNRRVLHFSHFVSLYFHNLDVTFIQHIFYFTDSQNMIMIDGDN